MRSFTSVVGDVQARWLGRLPLWRLLLAFGSAIMLLAPSSTVLRAYEPPSVSGPTVESRVPLPNFYLHVPASVRCTRRDPDQVAPVVVALHGMGGQARTFSQPLLAASERYGWVLVAPSFSYGEWRDPMRLVPEDLRLTTQLNALLDALPGRTNGVAVADRVYLFGFSRGAQLAHRFALFYPERVAGVVAFSAGTYTMPGARLANLPAPLPFGVADLDLRLGRTLDVTTLRDVPFLVGVGENDGNANDVPRQWDPYQGKTRIARATAFVQALQGLSVPAELRLFPGTGHGLGLSMIESGVSFFVRSSTDQ